MATVNGPEKTRGVVELSTREREIVVRAATGATDKEIADHLDISVATLRTYWIRVRDKLGAVNRTHAIALANLDKPAPTTDVRGRLVDAISRDRLATWVWQARSRHVLLDDHARRLFGLGAGDGPLAIDRFLAHVWSPDRARFERYLSQASDLRAMTPIELRVGNPGDYRTLVRTVNLASANTPEPGVLLATTTIHVFV